MSHSCRVPTFVNPAIEPALAALGEFLTDHHYSGWAMSRIVARVRAVGELASCADAGLLDPEDLDGATSAFVDNLPEIPFDSPAWDADESVYLDAEWLAAGSHPLPFLELAAPDGDWHRPDHPALLAAGIAPIAGGSPEGAYEPSPTEWADACAMFRRDEAAPRVPTAEDLAEMHARRDPFECLYGYE